jgi:hypothetical protein
VRFLIPLLLLFTASCVQNPVVSSSPVEPLTQTDYNRLLAKNTRKSNQYSGFYQTFQADATLLTTELVTAQLKERAHFQMWDQHQYQTEREKALQEASAYSKVFLRFFTPEHDYDDLAKPKTIWKVYLDFNGNRFEGKVKKLSDKFVEVQTLYPNFDRFSTPYEVTFNVPMTTVEAGACKVVLTSSLGSAEFSFPAGK